jgi:hypothetical protein
MPSWDTTVALAYAAEELFITAQALTTDLISREHGLSVAHQHLRGLLQHEGSLPSGIGMRLHKLDDNYSARENTGDTDASGADALSAATMSVLEEVRDVLAHRDTR